jgi:hypothetical protein
MPPDTVRKGAETVAQYWITEPGPRRPFREYVAFLWGEEDCDTDGNAASAEDRKWTELTIVSRRDESNRVDVDPAAQNPLTIEIRSERQDLAARLAYALAVTCGGSVSASRVGPPITAEALIRQMGDFDVKAATKRLR